MIEQVDWISDIATNYSMTYISLSLNADRKGLSLYSLDFLTRLLEKYSPHMINLCDLQGSIQDIIESASHTFNQLDTLRIPISLGLKMTRFFDNITESNVTQLFDYVKNSPWMRMLSMEFLNSASTSMYKRQDVSNESFIVPLIYFNQLNGIPIQNKTVILNERQEPVITLPVPSTTRPEPTTKPTYVPSTLWQTNLFLPYFDMSDFPPPNLVQLAYESTVKHFILSFVSANEANEPSWNGKVSMENNFYVSEVKSLRNIQGDIAISFGGPNLIELASVVQNPNELAMKYESVIKRYNVTWLDFYLSSDNMDGMNERNQAINVLKSRNVG